ncbi:septum formation family protein [Hamadaea tsunoensis]|uniref:septum formation family protein n=1 Tax=Hamadaea tsunoensis TaxID=53368 RepID=UPI0004161D78|nr:septum formation family protein [Hamadaea tsunoensis]
MRTQGRRGRLLAAAVMVLALAAGCSSLPAGVDGRLVDGWPMPAEAEQTLPKAGDCHSYVYGEEARSDAVGDPVPCDGPHIRETVYVGRFTGAAAQLAEPPPLYTRATAEVAKAQSDAYLDCNAQASRYLGHPWYDPRLRLHVTLPVRTAWQAGVRWYRCDIEEIKYDSSTEMTGGQQIQRTASLRRDWPATLCVEMNIDGWPERPCTAKHSGEFVGAFLMPVRTTLPKGDKDFAPLHAVCELMISKYTGISLSKLAWGDGVSWQEGLDYWKSGRRVTECYVWSGEKSTFTKSVKKRA